MHMFNWDEQLGHEKVQGTIRFYEELNDHLRGYPKKEDIVFSYKGRRSVKDLIESFGVPHCEVDLILVNSLSVAFDYSVKNGDRISVYPQFERFNLERVSKLRAEALRETKFVADVHLGKLVRKLRLLGFDTLYDQSWHDSNLVQISAEQRRVLLTCDRELLKHSIVEWGMAIRSRNPQE